MTLISKKISLNSALLLTGVMLTGVAQGAISSTANGNYTNGATWTGGAAPVNGEDYIIENNVEHAGGGTYGLAGDSVTINSGFLRFTGNPVGGDPDNISNITVNNLGLNGGQLHFRSSNQYSRVMNLNSGLDVMADSQIRIGDGGEQFSMNINLNGPISGSSDLQFLSNGGNDAGDIQNLNITSDNVGFSGDWSINSIDSGVGSLNANAANALGIGALVLNTRSRLVAGATGSLDSLLGITLNESSSTLVLNNAWTNSSASLDIVDGSLDLADSAS
ncbi:hypothetical protein NT6N_39340 [Oceaniferula spumae]|uniref:Autotransporter outer membrane beta-barrel domain-containing protein n=1 Tax=Oceaniferula spumae TaxID=2979115 RepID=A0AAT9FSK9_9BACT